MNYREQLFLTATGEGGYNVAIIIAHIIYFEEATNGGSIIYLDNGSSIHTKNPMDDILKRYAHLIGGPFIPD